MIVYVIQKTGGNENSPNSLAFSYSLSFIFGSGTKSISPFLLLFFSILVQGTPFLLYYFLSKLRARGGIYHLESFYSMVFNSP